MTTAIRSVDPKTYTQAMEQAKPVHTTLWKVVNVLSLGMPKLVEMARQAIDQIGKTKTVTVEGPVNLGTVVETELAEPGNRRNRWPGIKDFFNEPGEASSGTRLQRFVVEIKSKMERLSSKEMQALRRATEKEVTIRRVQLAALPAKSPEIDDARLALQLAVLRREGVKLAADSLEREQRLTQEVKKEAAAACDQATKATALVISIAKPDYLKHFQAGHMETLKNQLSEIQIQLDIKLLDIWKSEHKVLLEQCKDWSLTGQNPDLVRLDKLC